MKNSWGIREGNLFINLRACAGRAGIFGRIFQDHREWQAPFPFPLPQSRHTHLWEPVLCQHCLSKLAHVFSSRHILFSHTLVSGLLPEQICTLLSATPVPTPMYIYGSTPSSLACNLPVAAGPLMQETSLGPAHTHALPHEALQ